MKLSGRGNKSWLFTSREMLPERSLVVSGAMFCGGDVYIDGFFKVSENIEVGSAFGNFSCAANLDDKYVFFSRGRLENVFLYKDKNLWAVSNDFKKLAQYLADGGMSLTPDASAIALYLDACPVVSSEKRTGIREIQRVSSRDKVVVQDDYIYVESFSDCGRGDGQVPISYFLSLLSNDSFVEEKDVCFLLRGDDFSKNIVKAMDSHGIELSRFKYAVTEACNRKEFQFFLDDFDAGLSEMGFKSFFLKNPHVFLVIDNKEAAIPFSVQEARHAVPSCFSSSFMEAQSIKERIKYLRKNSGFLWKCYGLPRNFVEYKSGINPSGLLSFFPSFTLLDVDRESRLKPCLDNKVNVKESLREAQSVHVTSASSSPKEPAVEALLDCDAVDISMIYKRAELSVLASPQDELISTSDYFSLLRRDYVGTLVSANVPLSLRALTSSALPEAWDRSKNHGLKHPMVIDRIHQKGFECRKEGDEITVVTKRGELVFFKDVAQFGIKPQPLFKDKWGVENMLAPFVRVPKAKVFENKNSVAAWEVVQSFSPSKAVVKPLSGAGGDGITVGVDSLDSVRAALDKIPTGSYLIEEYISGNDYRIYVVGGDVIAVGLRVIPYVVGDGKSTLKSLINKKKRERSRKTFYKHPKREILVKPVLNKLMGSVPKDGEKVVIGETANISQGGECYDVTDIMHESFHEIAALCWFATDCVSDHFSIDLICEDIATSAYKQNYGILELNSRSGHGQLIYPYTGHGRRTPELVVDYWFPI